MFPGEMEVTALLSTHALFSNAMCNIKADCWLELECNIGPNEVCSEGVDCEGKVTRGS